MRFFFFLPVFFCRWLGYYWRAGTRHDVHSPFVSELTERLLEDRRAYYLFSDIRRIRRGLSRRKDTIRITDHGAGSRLQNQRLKRIRTVARQAAIGREAGEMLFRLVCFLRPRTMLELGTSLGLSAMYQAGADRQARFITVEGCPETAAVARTLLKEAGFPEIEVVNDTFAEALPNILPQLSPLDYLYLDGDHRREATLSYFEQCLRYAHPGSVFVIADIYWSKGMQSAWETMKQHPMVTLSVDLFHFGLLFFRSEQRQKAHFTLIKAARKPWRIGWW